MPQVYSLKDRKIMEPDNFGDPDRRLFLITNQEDVDKAPKRLKRHFEPEKVRDRIISIAKRKGFQLPVEWQVEVSIASKPNSEDTENTEK